MPGARREFERSRIEIFRKRRQSLDTLRLSPLVSRPTRTVRVTKDGERGSGLRAFSLRLIIG
jgi:hypothetical protein